MEKRSASEEYVWYASYGSNCSSDRFRCYLQGGRPEGAARVYQGCSDPSPPLAQASIRLRAALYFAQQSRAWHGGGVCFVDERQEQALTLGRMYLIRQGQLVDVIRQENQLRDAPISVDFEKVVRKGSLMMNEQIWYGKLLYLGQRDNRPIFTFTHARPLAEAINPPHPAYLHTIIRGLRETFALDDASLKSYLQGIAGIKGHPIEGKIHTLLSKGYSS